jgi:sec-independent protein translocase protein TatB
MLIRTTESLNVRMFDLTSSKLLILGIIALLVVGPKDLPILLRTIGKYMGMIRKQANEFRAQFDEAMKESELDTLRKEVENVGREAEATMRDAEHSVQKEVNLANSQVDSVIQSSTTTPEIPTVAPVIPPPPVVHVEPVQDLRRPATATNGSGSVNGSHHAEAGEPTHTPTGLPIPPKSEIKTGV